MSEKPETAATAPKSAPPRRSVTDRMAFLSFMFAVVFLSGLAGLLAGVLDLPPARWTSDAVAAARALYEKHKLSSNPLPKALWSGARETGRGVVTSRFDLMEPGYTLYTSGDESAATLIDAEGRQVHRWAAAFSKVWPDPTHIQLAVSDFGVYMRRGHVYPNGNLLALYETTFNTPGGLGLAMLDRESRVIWRLDEHCHHDMDVAADGRIYVLTEDIRREPHPSLPAGIGPLIEDTITVVSPEGKRLKQFSLLDAFHESPFYRQATMSAGADGDVLHTNTLNIVDDGFAARHEGVNAGQLMVCFRNINLVAIVDPDSEKLVWAVSGPWNLPHDSDPLTNGNILIFDNCCTKGQVVTSRVLEYDPLASTIVWEHSGSQEDPFRSDIRSCQQRLPNGNVLITESDQGRLLEVTSCGEVAWEFVNPVRRGKKDQYLPVVSGAVRYGQADVPFLATEDTANDTHTAFTE